MAFRFTPSCGSFTALAMMMATLLEGCGPTRQGGPVVETVPLQEDSVRRGKNVFDRHCHSCHSQGEGGMAPALNDKPLPRFLIRFQVRHGLGTMPSFPESRISDGELEDLARYVMALRRNARAASPLEPID